MRGIACGLIVGFILFSRLASAQEPKVRATLATKDDQFVGQRLILAVELLAPGYFAGAAAFDLPDPPGLLLVPPSGSPVISSETIADTAYTVQRHEVSVFAHRGGEQSIPPLTIRFQFKRNPLDKVSVPASVKTEPVRFTAKIPPGAEKLGSVISAKDFKAVESWKPVPGRAKAGDAFTRTITYSAPDVPAMAFPPFPAGAIDGMGIYPQPPEVLDVNERGSLSGRRRDAVSYVCQRAGRFVIPAVKLTWFDLDTHTLQTIDFAARTLDVAPSPEQTSALSAPEHHNFRFFLITLASALGICALAWVFSKTRATWLPFLRVFLPVHLAPLNPPETFNQH